MSYQRKTKDRWDIMTNWGYGWECENSEYTRADAKRSLREYRENLAGRADVRMEKTQRADHSIILGGIQHGIVRG